MSDIARFDAAVRVSLSEVRTLEPTPAEINSAVRAAAHGRRRPMGVRRTIVAIAVALGLLSGTALAIPQAREALFDVFGELTDFLTGRGDPPGEAVPRDAGRLSWFDGVDPPTGTVIAQANGTALVAFRGQRDFACLSYTLWVEECQTDDHWARQLSSSKLVIRGPSKDLGPTGPEPIFGIVADEIRAIDLVYADGSTVRTDRIRYGFVIFADPDRDPARLVGLDAAGRVVETVDISNLQWRESP